MDLESLLVSLRNRHNRFREGSKEKMAFRLHLKSLCRWKEEPLDYPNVRDTEFPTSIQIALDVCHPECGTREYIVDGSTQRCQHCGGLMFRASVAQYEIKK